MSTYHRIFEHGFGRIDPERAHHLGFAGIRAAAPVLRGLDWLDHRTSGPSRPVEALGLRFPNVLGLAAGFDKFAVGIDGLGGLGFGHVEIGTVTAEPQPGNPPPRIFRLPNDRALVNRMGFNNDGADVVAERLEARQRRLDRLDARTPGLSRRPVVGVNIGKTRLVPEDDDAAVLADHAKSARLLAPHADYLVVNVSSPNTPGLRGLQEVERLGPLLEHVRSVAHDASRRPLPVLVKIAPDLSDVDVLAVADLALEIRLDGIIATNTTLSREGLRSHPAQIDEIGAGGLSGRPLKARAEEVVRLLRDRVGPAMTLIGVGGITTPDDARSRLRAGADLVQAYTAFVYEGPLWPRRIIGGTA